MVTTSLPVPTTWTWWPGEGRRNWKGSKGALPHCSPQPLQPLTLYLVEQGAISQQGEAGRAGSARANRDQGIGPTKDTL